MDEKRKYEAEVDRVCDQLKTRLKERYEEHGYHLADSAHEVLGIVTEEWFELIEAVKTNSCVMVQAELVDVAVAALYGMMSLE